MQGEIPEADVREAFARHSRLGELSEEGFVLAYVALVGHPPDAAQVPDLAGRIRFPEFETAIRRGLEPDRDRIDMQALRLCFARLFPGGEGRVGPGVFLAALEAECARLGHELPPETTYAIYELVSDPLDGWVDLRRAETFSRPACL